MRAIATSLVGSYPQPDWLIDRDALRERLPPRVRARDLWRVDPRWLQEAQDDATVLAIRDQERAGLDIVTDGEIRRESYSNRFATALEGLDTENPGTILSRAGQPASVPRVVGPIRRPEPILVRDAEFLRAHTARPVKITMPGPFTMAQQTQDDFYGDERALALAYADVARAEMADLFAAGADIVQLDEPWLESRPDAARRLASETLDRALAGAPGTTCVHVCFGYPQFVADRPPGYRTLDLIAATPADQVSIEAAQPGLDPASLDALAGKTVLLGVLALDSEAVESAQTVAGRLRAALEHTPAGRLVAAPDCGMKYLPRDVAYAKLEALVAGAELAR
jgi:5-methyltetrahydropteroyltriglutamate--homocysteine methyltransferase